MRAYSVKYYNSLIELSNKWKELENKFVLDGVLLEGNVELILSNPTFINEDTCYPQSTVCYHHPKLSNYYQDLVEGDDVLNVLRVLVEIANDDWSFVQSKHYQSNIAIA